MRQTALALALLTWLSAPAHAQKSSPQLLIGAAHCLAVKNFLPSSSTATRTLGYFLDEKSYPHQKVIYVVNYAAPARPNGWVFVVFLTEHDGHQRFDIQNNAQFVLSGDEPIGVSFVGPPLGGTWTQKHIAMAIRRIEARPSFTLNNRELLAPTPSTTCESYTERVHSQF
ncbi:MAG: hypothetical protein WAN10_17900 [Candidatus Acidiferrales bacterium]